MRRIRPPAVKHSLPNRKGRFADRDFTPSQWSDYFTKMLDVELDKDNVFRVYFHQDEDNCSELPLLLLLHGGGFSALTWSVFVKSIIELCHVRILAIDIRGHGSTRTSNDEDLSIKTIINDISSVILKLFEDEPLPQVCSVYFFNFI